MKLVLDAAKRFLRQGAALAFYMKDGVVTIPEAAKIKVKGMLESINLTYEVPDKSITAIPTWDQLTDEQRAYVMDIPNVNVDVPEAIAQKAYECAVKRYEVVAMFLAADDVPENDLPPVATDRKLADVKGVGKSILGVLNTLGITTVEQLAQANAENLKEGLTKAGVMAPLVAKTESYIANAQMLLTDGK